MDAHAAASLGLVALLLGLSALGRQRIGQLWRRFVWAGDQWKDVHRVPPRSDVRPIEAIASDVHRLGRRFRTVPEGASFARFEGCRQAYDRVLAEACVALDVDHLLGVLPPGTDLDTERSRVETALENRGLPLDRTP